jgi:hypothetical protein
MNPTGPGVKNSQPVAHVRKPVNEKAKKALAKRENIYD